MRAILTGATGFVGKYLAKYLLEQGYEVTLIVREPSKLLRELKKNVYIIQADMSDLKNLDNSDFNNKTFDYFFHFGWEGTSGTGRGDVNLQLNNVMHSVEAVRLAARLGCKRFINAGSIMEFESICYMKENGAYPGLANIYSTAKFAADAMCKTVAADEKIDYINIIISNIFGPGENSRRLINVLLRKMMLNEPVELTEGTQLYDFIYIMDAVRGIVLAGTKGKSNTSYYLGNVEQLPLKDYMRALKK